MCSPRSTARCRSTRAGCTTASTTTRTPTSRPRSWVPPSSSRSRTAISCSGPGSGSSWSSSTARAAGASASCVCEAPEGARAAAQVAGVEAVLAHPLCEVRAQEPEVAVEHVGAGAVEARVGAERLLELEVERALGMPSLKARPRAQVDQHGARRDALDLELGRCEALDVETAQVVDPAPRGGALREVRVEVRLLGQDRLEARRGGGPAWHEVAVLADHLADLEGANAPREPDDLVLVHPRERPQL